MGKYIGARGLNYLWSKTKEGLDGKQDVVEDLADIRSGAAAGATAVQPGDNVSTLANDAHYVTQSDMMVGVIDANNHEYVDLGLPSGTLWATMNVGASAPEDYGNYYMYGYTTPYNSSDTPYEGTEDPLGLEHDAAHVNMGGDWHMPTKAQMEELLANTTCQWVTNYKGSGINGGTFTATNGAVLFLPAAGLWNDGSQVDVGGYGVYWGSSPKGDDWAYLLDFFNGNEHVSDGSREYGFSVRGVLPPITMSPKYATKQELATGLSGKADKSEMSVTPGTGSNADKTTIQLNSGTSATVLTQHQDISGKQDVISDLADIRSGASLGATAVQTETDPTVPSWAKQQSKPSYSYSEIQNTPTNVSAFTNDVPYVTQSDMVVPNVNANGHEYVDLGLPSGTLWATMNVGASAPEGYGNYYMYGYTTPYDSSDTPYSGTEDPLSLEHDAARVNWGGDWKMPTKAQMEELVANTTFEWTTINGINGGKFTAKNGSGNYIFIPAASFYYNGSLDNVGDYGSLWSSSRNGSSNAYYLYFSDGSEYVDSSLRKYGCSVRGVLPPITMSPKYATKQELATVAATIPAAQIQADWNQTDTSAKDYIKNKPTIPTVPETSQTVTENDTNPVSGGAVYSKLEEIIGTAPASLDTLGEIAAALNDDANLSATLTTQINAKIPKVSSPTNGNIPVLAADGTLTDSGHAPSEYSTKQELNTGLSGKQDTISDLDAIRSGAQAGATAIQPAAIADMEVVSNKVTSLSAQSTDVQYPSAKCVYDKTVDLQEAVDRKANIDGFYEGMGVGVAKRLEGNTDVAGSFLERPTGGNAELANGLAQLNEVQGGSVKFNQLVQNGDFSNGTAGWSENYSTYLTISANNNVLSTTIIATSTQFYSFGIFINDNTTTFVAGHKYLFTGKIKSPKETTFKMMGPLVFENSSIELCTLEENVWSVFSVITPVIGGKLNDFYYAPYANINSFAVNDVIQYKDMQIIDLTAIFGSGNEPSTIEDFEAWLAENVGLKDYYDYTEGEVVNNNMTGIESTGFNLFNPTTGKARIIGAYSEVYGNYYGITGTYGTLTFEDDLGNVSTVTPDADGKFELDVSGYLSVADAGNDVAVFLWWDGNKTEYEDYNVDIAHLDVRHIYGKKNGTGELVQVWPTGMPRINDLVDKLCIENGAVVAKRPIGEVDLGTLTTWAKTETTSGSGIYRFSASGLIKAKETANASIVGKLLCPTYEAKSVLGTYNGNDGISIHTNKWLYVYDSVRESLTAAQFKAAMSGVLLYYELATPETYTDLVYMGSEYFADGTPVALPVNYKVDNWGVETILPKNTGTILTAKPTVKVRYAIDAVEQLDTHEAFIEAMPENYVKRSTLAQGMGNSTVNAMSQDAITKLLNELYQSLGVAEGYIRVAGSSSPALSFKHYESSDFGQISAYSLFFPCLVGTKLSGGDEQVGKILHVLKKLGARVATSEDTGFTEGQAVWEDLEGTLHAIDGSEGDVMICNTAPYYRIMGRHTINGTEYDVFLMSSKPFTWQGITAEEVGKFGWAPDYCVSHTDSDSVQRMHSVYNPSWNGSYQAPDSCVGKFVYGIDAGTGDITETYDATATLLGGAGGLHSTDISLPNGEQYAMNNNADTTKTVPWMNATAAGVENMFALMLSEGGTFDAHNATLMGSGFCGNDGATTEADWAENASGAKNGMRLKDKNDAWKYYSIAGNVKTVLAKDANFYAGQMINAYRNPWHIMEAHRAVCYAVQNGVQELEWFVFEGNKYKYRSITGFRSPAQGEMTCVVFKLMATKAASNVVDPTDTTTSIEGNRIEFLVSTALLHGMTTQVSPSWWTSGLIFTEDENQGYEAYMERDQTKLIKSVAGDKLTSESWDFETAYKHVGTFTYGEGYRKNYSNDALMLPDTNTNKNGAGLHTYVGAYNWFTGTAAPTGKKSVRGFRRGYVIGSYLSPLTLPAYASPSAASSGYACGTCVRIED